METHANKHYTYLGFALPSVFVLMLGLSFIFKDMIPFEALQSIVLLGGSVGLIFVVFWISRRGDISIPQSPLFLVGLGIIGVSLLASLFSGSIPQSFFGFAYEPSSLIGLVSLLILSLSGALYMSGKRDIDSFLTGFCGLFFGFLLWALISVFFDISFVVSPAGVAILTSVVLLVTAYILDVFPLRIVTKVLAYMALVSALVMFFLVPFSLAKTLLIIHLVLGIGVCIFSFVRNTEMKEKFKIPVHLCVVFLIVVLIPATFLHGVFLEDMVNEVQISWNATGYIAAQLVSSHIQHVLIGTGPGTFPELWELFKPEGVSKTPLWNIQVGNATGFIPTHALTTGFLGMFLWMAGIISFYVWSFWQVVRLRDTQKFLIAATFVCVGSMSLLFSMFFVPDTFVLAVLFLLIGISIGAISGKVKTFFFSRLSALHVRIVFGLLIVLTLAVGYHLGSTTLSIVAHEKGVEAATTEGNPEKATLFLERAVKLRTHDTYLRSLTETYQRDITLLLETEPTRFTDQEFEILAKKAIESATRATEINPHNYLNWVSLGGVYERLLLLGIDGAFNKGSDAYGHAAQLSPQNPLVYFLRGRLLLVEGSDERKADAVSLFENVLRMKPDFTEAEELLERAKE